LPYLPAAFIQSDHKDVPIILIVLTNISGDHAARTIGHHSQRTPLFDSGPAEEVVPVRRLDLYSGTSKGPDQTETDQENKKDQGFVYAQHRDSFPNLNVADFGLILISWSPDGSYIAFDANRDGPPNIYAIPSRGGDPKRITSNKSADFHPSWSPDGSSIAFASLRTGNADIWVIPSEGGLAIQLTNHEAMDHHPVWSPDGKLIAFTSDREGNYDIWIVPASGGEPQQLTSHESDDDHVCWSPDSTKIAFMSKRSGNQDIWIISLPDGKPIRFTEEADNSWPNWSPDGTKIAYASNRAGNLDVWINTIDINHIIPLK
jgi:Tol biopolymer transport system component